MEELSPEWEKNLQKIVGDQEIHCRWLATLSQLELVGARKIVAYQPAVGCPLDILQHAAEESRHAWFFKSQIRKLSGDPDGQRDFLGGRRNIRILHRLDLAICRMLREADFSGQKLRDAAYLLTTLCIELRADWLYPLYEGVLQRMCPILSLRSIIREEEAHLAFVNKKIEEENLTRFIGSAREAESQFFSEFSLILTRSLSCL